MELVYALVLITKINFGEGLAHIIQKDLTKDECITQLRGMEALMVGDDHFTIYKGKQLVPTMAEHGCYVVGYRKKT
jgi:hypothetical protein